MAMIRKMLTTAAAAAALLLPFSSQANEGALQLDHARVDVRDAESLQAGARTFVNYCLNCHSANVVRYNRLKDLGLTEEQIKDNLLFTAELQRRLTEAGSHVTAMVAHPGGAHTDLGVEGSGITNRLMSTVVPFVTQSATAGARPIVRAATDR